MGQSGCPPLAALTPAAKARPAAGQGHTLCLLHGCSQHRLGLGRGLGGTMANADLSEGTLRIITYIIVRYVMALTRIETRYEVMDGISYRLYI